MYSRTQSGSMDQTVQMMTIAATLGDLTESRELCQGIPGYLRQTLNLEPLTLAVLRESPARGDSSLFLFCTSYAINPDASESLRRNMLGVGRQHQSSLNADELPIGQELDFSTASDQLQLKDLGRTTHITQKVDAEHHLILALHQRNESPPLSTETYDQLELISRQLARLLSCLVKWHTHPSAFGEEYKAITSREFEILRSLETDMSEKQLADNLNISLHTLHAHVKSIYRRLGVQGRLSAIKCIEESRRAWRIKHFSEGISNYAPTVLHSSELSAFAG